MSVAESVSTSHPNVNVDMPTIDPSKIPDPAISQRDGPRPGPSQGNFGIERERCQGPGDGIESPKTAEAWLCRDCNTKNRRSSKWCYNCWSMGFLPSTNNTSSRKRRSSTHRSDPHTAAAKSLECTACKATPTRGRLLYYTCEDGHVVCQMCVSDEGKKKLCPSCTGVAKRLKKNPFVGRLADRVTQPRDSPSPAATREKEPKPLPAGLDCLRQIFAERNIIRDRDLENARTVKRKLRHLFDDVQPHLSGFVDKETLDANAREFALTKIANDRNIEWSPSDDEIADLKHLLINKDYIFQYLRWYEIFISYCFAQKEIHQKCLINLITRRDQNELKAHIQKYCGVTEAEAHQVINEGNISDELVVVQGQSFDNVSPTVILKMILAKVLSVRSTLDYFEELNPAIKAVRHLFRDEETFLLHVVKHGHEFNSTTPGEYWNIIEKVWAETKRLVMEKRKTGRESNAVFEVSFKCKDGQNVTKADILDVTNSRAPKRLTPPDCWLLGVTGSKKVKYEVETFEKRSHLIAVKIKNLSEDTFLSAMVTEDNELDEVKSFHRVGPLGGSGNCE